MPGSGAQATLKAGNAPVVSLVLHRVVGGGDHLPSGDPQDKANERLVFFHKKKTSHILLNIYHSIHFF